MRLLAIAVAFTLLAPPLRGQTTTLSSASGAVRLDREVEIALARSAAPPHVSGDATVLVLEGNRFVTAVEGTNGVTCYVSRSHPESQEPHCFDAEGSRTILPIHVREVELRLEGKSEDAVKQAIAQGMADGSLQLPRRPAMSYMMSAGQVLYDEGRRVGAWKPHLMIYLPFVTGRELGLSGPPTGSLMVFEEGAPTASIVIVVPDFVQPATEGASSR